MVHPVYPLFASNLNITESLTVCFSCVGAAVSNSASSTVATNFFSVSGDLVPLTIIKGAGHEFIPFPAGENATVADFHS